MSQPTEIHTLAGAYALDALTEIERASFARHMANCGSCALEVAELTETAARLSAESWEAPPARLRAAVLAEVGQTRQVSNGTKTRGTQGEARRWRRFAAASIAAGVVAVGGVAAVWSVQQGRINDLQDQSRRQLQADQARLDTVLSAPDATVASAGLPDGGRMIVALSPSRNNGVVMMSGVPAPPEGKAYQLWFITGESPASIGVMPPGIGSGTAAINAPRPGDRIGVTIEPEGGSRAPTSTPLALITVA